MGRAEDRFPSATIRLQCDLGPSDATCVCVAPLTSEWGLAVVPMCLQFFSNCGRQIVEKYSWFLNYWSNMHCAHCVSDGRHHISLWQFRFEQALCLHGWAGDLSVQQMKQSASQHLVS